MNRIYLALAFLLVAISLGFEADAVDGKEVPQQPGGATASLADLTAAANQGDISAQIALALKYDKGDGVAQDKAQAFTWLLKAAEQGNAEAQYLVGNSYKTGDAVLKDDVEALAWRRKSADNGYVQALLDLGYEYAHGIGVQQNNVEAARLFDIAAAKGNPLAQNFLGEAYAAGQGVDRDDHAAQQWFTKAAVQGLPSAQFNLGNLYLNSGAQTKTDQILGYMWLEIAARQNDSAAILGRDVLGKYMRAADIKKAKNFADACVASRYAKCAQ